MFRGGYLPHIIHKYLEQAPLPHHRFLQPRDVAFHDQMVSLVERMINLHKQLASSMTEHEKTMLSRQIRATDDQIDSLVYELYGLTDEEIRIVEAENKPK